MMKCSMDENERDGAVVGPVGSEGGRSPSLLSMGQDAPPGRPGGQGQDTPGTAGAGPALECGAQARGRAATHRGEAAELLSRELGLPVFKLEQWRRRAEAALEGALKEREADPADGSLPPPCSASAS